MNDVSESVKRISEKLWIVLTGLFLVLTPLLFWYKTSNPYIIKDVFFEGISLLLLSIVFLKIAFSKDVKIIKNPLILPYLLYLGFTVISVIWAWGKYESFYEIIYRLTAGFLIFPIYYLMIDSEKNLKLFYFLIILTGVIVSIYGIPQSYGIELLKPSDNWSNPYGSRVMSTLGNPNFAAGYLLSVLPLSLSLFFFSNKRSGFLNIPYRVIFFFSTFLILWCMISTQTRGTLIAGIIGIFLFIFIYFYLKLTSRKHEEETYKKSGKKFLIYAGVLIVVVIFLIFLSGVGIQKRIATTKRQIQFSEGSIGQRYLMWTVGLKMAKENPVLGVGVGMFRLLYPDYQGQFLMDKKFLRQNTHARHPHNEVIENANELGIFGFTVFLWFFASIFIFGLRLLRSLRNDRLFPYLLGAFITVIVMMIHELVSVVLRYASPMISLWSAIGFIAVIYKLRVKTLASSEYTEKNCLIQIKEQTIIRFRPVLVGAAILIFIFNLFWTGNNYRILIGSKYFSNGLGIMDLVSTRNLPPNLPKEFMDADKFNLAVKSFEYFEKSSKYDPKYLNNYYRMGNCFLLMRECYKNYFIVYSRLRKLEPNIPEQYILLYRQIQDSLETVNRVMDNPDNPDEYFEKAAEYFREGDKYKPSYSEINFNLGICLYNLGKNRDPEKIRESIEYIKRAIEIEPINVNALKKLGNIYFETGQEEEARKVYDRLFQVLRTELEIDSRILEFEKEKIGRQDFSFRNLERRFEMLSVNYRKTLLNRDEVYEKAKAVKNEKLQDEYYKLFIDELRKFRDLLKDRVLIYQDLQKRDDVKLTSEEINIIKKTIEVDLNDYFWAVYREGKLHRDYNDIEAVEKVFSEGLDFGPVKSDRNKSVLLMNKLTDYYWELNLNEKLYSYLDQLTEQTPSDLRFEIKRSLFLYLGKDYAGSSGTIVKISDRIKDFSVYNLVVESYADRQPKVIADYFIFASEYDKRNRTDLLQQAGLIYVQSLKDYANAKKAFMKYIQVNPNSHIGYYSLGSVYFVEQNYKEALKNWEKALELDPGNSDLQNNVKLVREKVKEK